MFQMPKTTTSDTKKIRGFVFYLFLMVLSAHFFELVSEYFLGEDAEVQYFEKNTSLFKIFFVSVVIAPMLETIVFQWLIYKIFYWLKINQLLYVYLISAALFGLVHTYNMFTVLDAFIAGLIFIHYFHINYKNSAYSIMHVYLLHASYNFYAFCLDDLKLFQF